MRSAILAAGLAMTFTTGADAAAISITGVAGSGVVTISLSGTAQARADGTLKSPAETAFDNTRDLQFSDFIANPAIQDQLLTATGNLSISQGGSTAIIDALFLDEDTTADPSNPDDFGFRSTGGLAYTVTGGDLIFAGSATIPLDINDFVQVSNVQADFDAANFIARDQIDMTVTIQAIPTVPLPAGLPLLGAGLGLMALWRRRS